MSVLRGDTPMPMKLARARLFCDRFAIGERNGDVAFPGSSRSFSDPRLIFGIAIAMRRIRRSDPADLRRTGVNARTCWGDRQMGWNLRIWLAAGRGAVFRVMCGTC